ncbi:MAG TPA: glycosyltransferase family 4 protein [Thermoanaerobaculia bacterium]|nr:glycosyltransferase family 4 protein [Thermoanaerobaculia bacterium]
MSDTAADPNRGAAGTEVRTMHALRVLGHEVDAIWSDDLGRRIQHGNLHILLEQPRAYERAVVAALRRQEYDVVHVNQPHGFRAARAVHMIAPKTVFIHRSHGFELNVEETLRPWLKKFGSDERNAARRLATQALAPQLRRHSKAIAREADGHVVSSSLDAAFLHERMGVPSEKIATIPQAAPDSFMQEGAPTMTAQRLRRVLNVGQFAFVKGPMIAAAAMNKLAQSGADLCFTWVCDGASEASIRALLNAEANARLEIIPWTTQEALRDLYDAHGIFLFPSFFEGFGKAFLEAMSRGLCVVASDAGGMHDVITSGSDGVLIPPGDANAVADSVLAIVSDPARASAMSTAAAVTARRYSWDRVARELTAFYENRLNAMRR